MQKIKNLVYGENASELVEFAVASTLLFTLIFGIIEFCLALYTCHFVESAAEQGARYAMVRGSSWKNACSSGLSYDCQAASGDVQNYVTNLSPGSIVNLTASNVNAMWPGTAGDGAVSPACAAAPHAQGCQVMVTVNYSFNLNVPFVPQAAFPFSTTSTETIQN